MSKVIICRCEDVTEEEVVELIRQGYTTIDELKRFLRTGMGHCQGRTCGRLVAQLIARETSKTLQEIKFARPRPPIIPVPLKTLANKTC